MTPVLPNGLELKVAPVWVRHGDDPRLLILHFWQTALTPRQLSAAAAILRMALLAHLPRYAGLEIDFVSVAISERTEARRFENFGWKQLAPLEEPGLDRFSQLLAAAWTAYGRIGPREIKRRPSQGGLFD